MKKSVPGTAIAAKVGNAFSTGSALKVALRVEPGVRKPFTHPMGAVATCRRLNALNVPLLKPKRSGPKLMLFAGAGFCTVMLTLTARVAAWAVRPSMRVR